MLLTKGGSFGPKVERLLWMKAGRRVTYGLGTTDRRRFVRSSRRSDEAYDALCDAALDAGVDLVLFKVPLPARRREVPHFLSFLAAQVFPLPSSWIHSEPANDVDLSHKVTRIDRARKS